MKIEGGNQNGGCNITHQCGDERLHRFTRVRHDFPIYGLEIANVVPLPQPVKCRGHGELWEVPQPVLKAMEEAIA